MDLTRLRSAIAHELRDLPRQFWILVAGTLFYVIGVNMCVPFEALYMTGPLEISMATTGLLIGLMGLVGLPLQFPGGTMADRLGRPPVLIVAVLGSITFCVGLSFARSLWQVALLLFVDAAFGWPMYLTSTHTMIADLVPIGRRAEALSIIRTGINVGAALGPLLAAALLSGGGEYRLAFLIGAGFCAVFLVMTLTVVRETHPTRHAATAPGGRPQAQAATLEAAAACPEPGPACLEPGPAYLEPATGTESAACPEPATKEESDYRDGSSAAGPGPSAAREARGADGYGVVFRDTYFLAFCAVMLLALYGLGQLWVTLPVVLEETQGIDAADWGLLLTVFNVSAAALQYPLVRALRLTDPVLVEAIATLVISGSVCATVFVPGAWNTFLFMIAASVGYVLLLPIGTGIVSGLAPLRIRGRYLGVWTFVFLSGYSMGPLLGGIVVSALGARPAYVIVAATGAAAATLPMALRPVLRRRATQLADVGAVS